MKVSGLNSLLYAALSRTDLGQMPIACFAPTYFDTYLYLGQ